MRGKLLFRDREVPCQYNVAIEQRGTEREVVLEVQPEARCPALNPNKMSVVLALENGERTLIRGPLVQGLRRRMQLLELDSADKLLAVR